MQRKIAIKPVLRYLLLAAIALAVNVAVAAVMTPTQATAMTVEYKRVCTEAGCMGEPDCPTCGGGLCWECGPCCGWFGCRCPLDF